MDTELRMAYLRRLGLDAEPPSVEALQRLHRRQVAST
jgi:N-hydroxyarylamine O-acetyltransferase